jgi:hypothetical protein
MPASTTAALGARPTVIMATPEPAAATTMESRRDTASASTPVGTSKSR